MDTLRIDKFVPYINGKAWTLVLSDTGRTIGRGMFGRNVLAYTLTGPEGEVLFEGDDFKPSPMLAIDSDAAVADLMGFLTLKPGDTDREYFDKYTPEQMAFAQRHGESLGCIVSEQDDGSPAEPDGVCWVRVE